MQEFLDGQVVVAWAEVAVAVPLRLAAVVERRGVGQCLRGRPEDVDQGAGTWGEPTPKQCHPGILVVRGEQKVYRGCGLFTFVR